MECGCNECFSRTCRRVQNNVIAIVKIKDRFFLSWIEFHPFCRNVLEKTVESFFACIDLFSKTVFKWVLTHGFLDLTDGLGIWSFMRSRSSLFLVWPKLLSYYI